jgi:hypothetical protein
MGIKRLPALGSEKELASPAVSKSTATEAVRITKPILQLGATLTATRTRMWSR